MPRIKTLLVCFFLMSTITHAQTFFSQTLEGQIKSEDKDVADVHVLNTTSGRATITDVQGFFKIVARPNDTIYFSAVHYKKKEIVVSLEMLNSKMIFVTLESFTNELDEVIVRPFNLSGDLSLDMKSLEIDPVVTASTLNLPNAYAKNYTQSERLLKEAAMPKFNIGMLLSLPVNPIINAITGRTKMLKNRVTVDKKYAHTQAIEQSIVDSLFINELKIPKENRADFMYFCEVDEEFQVLSTGPDELKLWAYLRKKSEVYRKNNELD